MNVLQMSPTSFPGIQTSTLTNAALGTERKKFQIVGTAYNANSYVDIYVGFVSDKTKIRVVAGQSIPENQIFEASLPQASTYIVKSSNFTGFLFVDLGTNAEISASVQAGSVISASPDYAFKLALTPSTYDSTNSSVWLPFGPVPGFVKTIVFNGEIRTAGTPLVVTIEEADDDSGTGAQAVTIAESSDGDDLLSSLSQGFVGCAWGSFNLTKPYVQVTVTAPPVADFSCSVVLFEQPIV